MIRRIRDAWLRWTIAAQHGIPPHAHRMTGPRAFHTWVSPKQLELAADGIIRRDYADLLELNLTLFEASRAGDPLTYRRTLHEIRAHIRARGAEV